MVILLLVQAVIDANIIPCLVNVVHNAEFEVKKEAACAIFNVTSKGSDDNIRYKKTFSYAYYCNDELI